MAPDKWTIRGLDRKYLLILERSLDKYAEHLQNLKDVPHQNIKRTTALASLIASEQRRQRDATTGTINVSKTVKEIEAKTLKL